MLSEVTFPVRLILATSFLTISCTTVTAKPPSGVSFDQLINDVDSKVPRQSIVITPEGFCLPAPMQAMKVVVSPACAKVRSVSETEGYGDFSVIPVIVKKNQYCHAVPSIGIASFQSDCVIQLDRAIIIERYSSSSRGIRQDFLVTRKPRGEGNLELKLSVRGALVGNIGKTIAITIPSGRRFTYDGLLVTDSGGNRLEAKMVATDKRMVTITVRDENAIYPITIDPTISDADWMAMIGHTQTIVTDGAINSLAYTKGVLYVGGYFSVINNCGAKGAATWDGSRWSSLNSTDNIVALAVDSLGNVFTAVDSAIPAYGAGAEMQFICRRDHASGIWRRIGNSGSKVISENGPKTKLYATGSGDLYIVGSYSLNSTYPHNVNKISKWSNGTWINLDSLRSLGNNLITASAFDEAEKLFVAGSFSAIGGVPVNGLAQWNGSTWINRGSANSNVKALAVDKNGIIYMGGSFKSMNGVNANSIVMCRNGVWTPLGSGTSGAVSMLAPGNAGELFAYGKFDTIGTVVTKNLAKWDGNSWVALGSEQNLNNFVCDGTGGLYVAGVFDSIAGVSAQSIAYWTTNTGFRAISPGTTVPDVSLPNYPQYYRDCGINASCSDNKGNLYIGGDFYRAGGLIVNSIARWDGSKWHSLGSGMEGWYNDIRQYEHPGVYAITIDKNGNVFAGGNFSTAGSNAADCIAVWDGIKWSSIGTGNDSTKFGSSFMLGGTSSNCCIYSLAAAPDGSLYAGGRFKGGVARWDGAKWTTLGLGLRPVYVTDEPYVFALHIASDGMLYAGGNFTGYGSTSTVSIAQWNGSEWKNVGGADLQYKAGGNYATINAITSDEKGNFYIGGRFDFQDTTHLKNIAQLNGSNWMPLGAGVSKPVRSLVIDGRGTLYAGGDFDSAGNTKLSHTAMWDGKQWSALGSGTDSLVKTMTFIDSSLYVGGNFTTAGGLFSPRIAKANAHAPGPVVLASRISSSIDVSINMYLSNALLHFNGIEMSDRISIFTLQGKLLCETVGTSVVDMRAWHHQRLIIRVSRFGKVCLTAMMVGQ